MKSHWWKLGGCNTSASGACKDIRVTESRRDKGSEAEFLWAELAVSSKKKAPANRDLIFFGNLQTLLYDFPVVTCNRGLRASKSARTLWEASDLLRPKDRRAELFGLPSGPAEEPFHSTHKPKLAAISVPWQVYQGRTTGITHTTSRIQRGSASIVPASLWLWAKYGIPFTRLGWKYINILQLTKDVTFLMWRSLVSQGFLFSHAVNMWLLGGLLFPALQILLACIHQSSELVCRPEEWRGRRAHVTKNKN